MHCSNVIKRESRSTQHQNCGFHDLYQISLIRELITAYCNLAPSLLVLFFVEDGVASVQVRE
jgi:hypothetical protein